MCLHTWHVEYTYGLVPGRAERESSSSIFVVFETEDKVCCFCLVFLNQHYLVRSEYIFTLSSELIGWFLFLRYRKIFNVH